LPHLMSRGGWPTSGLAMALLGVTVLAGCASGVGGTPSRATAATNLAVASPAGATAIPAAFPVALTDDAGTLVTVPAEPHRIVSLTPGTTEILFALGAGDRVVATDSASDYPATARQLPHVASFGAIDIEQVVALGADLIVAGGAGYTPPDGIARLRSLGLPVLVVYAASVRGVLADVELLGRAIGRAAAGSALATSMGADLDAVAATVRDKAKPRVFYEVDATLEIYGPADHSFLAEMVSLAGGVPITSGSANTFALPLERLIAADPEVIVLGDAAFGTTPDSVRQRPGWSVLTAVVRGAIRPVDDKLVTRPGPRLAAGLRSLILALHPEAVLP
jgi:iron complex transport system substrate-binding protein